MAPDTDRDRREGCVDAVVEQAEVREQRQRERR